MLMRDARKKLAWIKQRPMELAKLDQAVAVRDSGRVKPESVQAKRPTAKQGKGESNAKVDKRELEHAKTPKAKRIKPELDQAKTPQSRRNKRELYQATVPPAELKIAVPRLKRIRLAYKTEHGINPHPAVLKAEYRTRGVVDSAVLGVRVSDPVLIALAALADVMVEHSSLPAASVILGQAHSMASNVFSEREPHPTHPTPAAYVLIC